jgi:hypothetical protein
VIEMTNETIKPVAWKAKSGNLAYDKASFMPSTRKYATPLYDQAALDQTYNEALEKAASWIRKSNVGDSSYDEQIARSILALRKETK